MKKITLTVFLSLFFLGSFAQEKYILVIHGGAGTILRKNMTPQKEEAYKAVLSRALEVGYKALNGGSSAMDAVQAAIMIMEDSPLFNAGKGAVFTHEGRNELDAAVMDGETRKAGAVAGVTIVRNPITAARAVMEKSEHVLLVGKGAEEFSKSAGLTVVAPSYFYTPERWEGLQRALKEDERKSVLDHTGKGAVRSSQDIDQKFGTVGAVALDRRGNLAAGTSTGGMTNKRYGRVGDAPLIGAGTYADNATAGISCTGWGEYFIRNVVAYDVAAMMAYKGMSVDQAAQAAIKKVADAGGDGGLIALDRKGNVSMPFNTAGMYRGTVTETGKVKVEIYK